MFEHGLILQTERELFRLWLQYTASAVATLHAQVWSLFTPERLWAHLCSGCVCLLSCPALPNPTSTDLFGENCYWSDLLCIISSASTFSDIVSCRILGEIQDWKCFSDPSFWEEVGTWVFGELEAGRGDIQRECSSRGKVTRLPLSSNINSSDARWTPQTRKEVSSAGW